MDAVVDEHCCPDTRGDAEALEAPDCCEARTIAALPSAAGAPTARSVPAAPLVGVLPAVGNNVASAVVAPGMPLLLEETGPPSPAAAERAVRLMVFLI
jgi:hypothetical protein